MCHSRVDKQYRAMGRGLWVMVVVVGLYSVVNETHTASLPSKAPRHALISMIKETLDRGVGHHPLESLIAHRILFSRLTSIAQDLGYRVYDAMDAVKTVAYQMTADSSLWATVTSELMTPPRNAEIYQAVKAVVRDLQSHRAWVTHKGRSLSSDKIKTWFSRIVNLIFGEKLPELLPPPPPPHAVPRTFSFFSSPEVSTDVNTEGLGGSEGMADDVSTQVNAEGLGGPEGNADDTSSQVNTEGLQGLQSMATDLAEAFEESKYIENLQEHLHMNTLFTTYAFVITEFLEDLGLGEVTSVGVLTADIWFIHEIITELIVWIEERCFLSTRWPFFYFYPEHCREEYEAMKNQQAALAATAEGVTHQDVAEAATAEDVAQAVAEGATAQAAAGVAAHHAENE